MVSESPLAVSLCRPSVSFMPSSRAARAADRADELAGLRRRLVTGGVLTAEDLELGQRRALQSRQWALEAYLRSAERHEAAARAHERAAWAHENAHCGGPREVAHHVAADDHRRAAVVDRAAAADDRRRAAEVEQLDSAS